MHDGIIYGFTSANSHELSYFFHQLTISRGERSLSYNNWQNSSSTPKTKVLKIHNYSKASCLQNKETYIQFF